MYAFGPIPKQQRSGRVIGTHQKIDRVARRHLTPHLKARVDFPVIHDILHFEGSRGPDAIKMKSPGRDEPWHFIDPGHITSDDVLLVIIRDHSANLTEALAKGNPERAAFEAAWLAHAVTDGLTPAHHDPMDDQVKDLRASDHRKDTFRSRIIMTGNGSGKTFVQNNWKYWGVKGIATTHALFEAGVATTAKPLRFNDAAPTNQDIANLTEHGFEALYIDTVKVIDSLHMYDQFKRHGWTHDLARQTSRELLPTIIRAVTLAWYEAYSQALEVKQ